MNSTPMTSLQRVLTTLGHQEPDRVPLFLLFTVTGARELGLSIRDYFSDPAQVAEGQLRLREKYHNDCLYGFYYAAVETEAWGSEPIWFDDGPPNAGRPIITKPEDIDHLEVPEISQSACLTQVLEAQKRMKDRIGDEAPIIGVAISPFSLPVMQMGFSAYFELIYNDRERFHKLMALNEAFSIAWANAQLEAGATAICYFDPVSSPTNIPPELYAETGQAVAKRTIAAIHGPTATHFASGNSLSIIEQVCDTGTAVMGISTAENLTELKAASRGKISLLGNLNGVEMRRWSPEEAEAIVKETIRQAGPGGGFILSDNHGEIPWQVPHEVLEAISQAVRRWGNYPLAWTEQG
uniref:Putative Uroporphyrinogen decarboxylase n=1 Tax=Magnetococcus massalia (strain MO-1) TaxID=451514 RepID=A0A1S7LJR3_MAGMO|nr:putative Uroporphyrinogen decarboxylase [Candidatus Magnetococcus massalia]